MGKKSHKKTKPSSNQRNEEPLEDCEYCNREIKRGDIISCKCSYTFFCSTGCRKKSEHFKQLCKGDDFKVFSPQAIEDVIDEKMNMLQLSNSDEKRKLRSELKEVAGKSFEELSEMEENSSASYVLGMSLDKNVSLKDATPLLTCLPEHYSQLIDIKRKAKAVEYMTKACEASNLLACYVMFCETNFKDLDMFSATSRLFMDSLALCYSKSDAKEVRETFRLHSQFLSPIYWFIKKYVKQEHRIPGPLDIRCASFSPFNTESRIGNLVLHRCLKYMISVPNPQELKEKLDLDMDDLCVWETLNLTGPFRQVPSSKHPTFIPMIPIKEREEMNRNILITTSVKYVQPVFNEESAMNDLRRVTSGLKDLEMTKRARYVCYHWIDHQSVTSSPPPAKLICRACFMTGISRVRAVASQACFMSVTRVDQRCKSGSQHTSFGVIFQKDNSGERVFECYPHVCKEELTTILKLLSLHSADIDPRMLCFNPDLYWSIIWYYGSVTEALKQVGGERLLDKAFGPHDQFTEMELKQHYSPIFTLEDKFRTHQGVTFPQDLAYYEDNRASIEVPYLLENNFSKGLKKMKVERYRCSFKGCFELEDETKFLNCAGCVKVFKRKFCSVECQARDWDSHQQFCGVDNSVPQNIFGSLCQ